jgi:DNA-binding NarL/FixJ family response regulator
VIADDDDSMRALVRTVLQDGGYQVVAEADNGADALAQISTHRPAIAVLDEQMPYMNGTRAARLIRRAAPEVKIVICSTPIVTPTEEFDATIAKQDVAYLPLTLDRVTQ